MKEHPPGTRLAFYPEHDEFLKRYSAEDGAEGIVLGYQNSYVVICWDDPRAHGQAQGGYFPSDFREVDDVAVKSAALLVAEADLEREKQSHLADLNKVFSALRDESESRGWCDEYQVFVEDLVKTLTMKPTEGVPTDWELDVLGITVKVNAYTEDEATDKLHSFLNNSMYRGVLETE